MKANELIELFERMYREKWSYEMGAARIGCVDCSGAFVWAYKQFGLKIAHGSNSIVRQSVGATVPITEAKPGYAAFKRRRDGGEPEKFQNDGIGNVYHIGLVSRDGRHVLNAKGTQYGFCMDALNSSWHFAAPLLDVSYEEESAVAIGKARVTTEKDPLRVRSAEVTGKVIGKVPKGEIVDILQEGSWPKIQYGKLVGYASGEFLTRITASEPETEMPEMPAEPSQGGGTVTATIIDDAGRIFVPQGGWRVTMSQGTIPID